MINTIVERVKLPLKISDTDESKDELLGYFAQIALDRILLRLSVDELPVRFDSIACEVVVALYRRLGSEGIENKQVDVIATKFIADVLANYEKEFAAYTAQNDLTRPKNVGVFL